MLIPHDAVAVLANKMKKTSASKIQQQDCLAASAGREIILESACSGRTTMTQSTEQSTENNLLSDLFLLL
jgi:hypothetical protein